MPAQGKQFKKVNLPSQSEEEIRAVVAKGNARARARRGEDMSDYEKDLSVIAREEKSKGRKDEASLNTRGRQASDYKFMPNLTDREHAAVQRAQNMFETSVGAEREKHRSTIGKAIQKGVVDATKVRQLACQTPNCGQSVSTMSSKGDVICAGCSSKGDTAGATYKDRPKTVMSGDRSDVGTQRSKSA